MSGLQSCMRGSSPSQCRNDAAARSFADGMHATLQIEHVHVRSLSELTASAGIRQVDWLSLDVEGAELRALQSLDFVSTPTSLITAEGNSTSVARHLTRNSFIAFPSPPVAKAAGLPDLAALDTWYLPLQTAKIAFLIDWNRALHQTRPSAFRVVDTERQ